MRKVKEKIRHRFPNTSETSGSPVSNQTGGVTIVLILMVMAIMTVIGIVSSRTIVTENLITRNMGIHKQNTSVLNSALMEALQRFMEIRDDDPDNFIAAAPDLDTNNNLWINDRNAPVAPLTDANWYEGQFSGRCLVDGTGTENSSAADSLPLLTERGENGNGNLRYAVLGYWPVDLGNRGSSSLRQGNGPVWHQGRILAEYVSSDAGGNDNGFGLMRMEIGVKRQW